MVTAMVDRAAGTRTEMRPDLPARVTSSGLTSNLAQHDLLGSAGGSGRRWSLGSRSTRAVAGVVFLELTTFAPCLGANSHKVR